MLRDAKCIFIPLPPLPSFPRALAQALLCQVQETGREGLGTRREPEVRWKCQPCPPWVQSPLTLWCFLDGSSSAAPPPHPVPFVPTPILPSLPSLSQDLTPQCSPPCSSPCWDSEWCGKPRDRTGFILGKNIHGRGYHSNKFPWCLDTR